MIKIKKGADEIQVIGVGSFGKTRFTNLVIGIEIGIHYKIPFFLNIKITKKEYGFGTREMLQFKQAILQIKESNLVLKDKELYAVSERLKRISQV